MLTKKDIYYVYSDAINSPNRIIPMFNIVDGSYSVKQKKPNTRVYTM